MEQRYCSILRSDQSHTDRTFTDFLNSLFGNTWTLVKSPAGALQFEALNGTDDYPDPFNKTFRHATMLVSDLALREDPTFSAIASSWVNDFEALTNAFAAAWCKSLPPCIFKPPVDVRLKQQSSFSTVTWVPSPVISGQMSLNRPSSGRILSLK